LKPHPLEGASQLKLNSPWYSAAPPFFQTMTEATLPEICGITALPAISMALGSMAVSAGQPSEKLEARLQHLSAGLLLGAVTTEIFPILRSEMVPDSRINWSHVLTAMLGFASALTLMYSLKSLGLEDDDEEEETEAATKAVGPAVVSTLKEPLLGVSSDEEHAVQSPTELGWVLAKQPSEEECSRLRWAVSRLQAKGSNLRSLVDAEEVDREALDEEVHNLDFLVDSARRICRGAEPIEPRNANRLRHHVSQLVSGIERLQHLDLSQPVAVDQELKQTAACVRHIHSHAERATFRRWHPPHREVRPALTTVQENEASRDSIPTTLVPLGMLRMIVAVVVDSSVDGMLIGLAGSVARGSGFLMAIATAIEMGFLGYSFACSLTKALRNRCWMAAVILAAPPITMLKCLHRGISRSL